MIRNVVFSSIHRILVIVLLCIDFDYHVKNDLKFFDVRKYGAIGDGRFDCTKAFMSCWNDVCKWKGKAQFLVPFGTYLVRQLQFSGPCLGPVDFHNAGVLKAHYNNGPDFWVMFKYIDNLAIFGGGSFDGQGPTRRLSEKVTPNYQNQVTSLSLDFVTNSRMDTMKFINSKNCRHIKVFACHDIRISHITISSPEHSPNTDGINIGNSKKIQVSDSYISSGDDCISILSGGQDINITGIHCGPGHGISIGSLGGRPNEPDVKGIIVRNCNFTNTLNGVRIKTWANNNAGNAAYISFENIFINNAYNPIIIDQHYCPSRHCQEGDSHIHISNVKFTNIRGISKSRCAVNFQCSKYRPCQIETRDIDLVYNGVEGPAISSCSNVHGIASGCEKPPSCISKYVL